MENYNNDDKWLCQLMWAIGFVLLVMMLSAFIVIKLIEGWDHRGQFGDLFGVVNALFSGLAFAGYHYNSSATYRFEISASSY